MKNISEFREAVKELAILVGQTYWSVNLEVSEHRNSEPKAQYRAYVNNFESGIGKTPEEAILKLRINMKLDKEEYQTEIEI